MKTGIALAALLLALTVGCSGENDQPTAQQAQAMRTIENTQVPPVPVEEPPVVDEAIPLAIPKYATPEEIKQIRENSKLRVELPFAPAIAIDPVDGGKVSIRSNTPMVEYKKKIYYFSSAATKATFEANPEQYTKSQL
jgi:YHS domain-containing protein